ncbi:MAG: hypothetical protein L6V93_15115 [Clostridiales bacterium]|nr:MAG: hypothetical protein L6V93_15115 [Clostridiales bacterium]
MDREQTKQQNSKLTLSKVPAGTYDNIIVYAVGNDGYRIGKYVSVTVGKKSIENNSDITIKIKGKDAPYELTYTSGIQVKESDVQVFDNGVDVTSFLTSPFRKRYSSPTRLTMSQLPQKATAVIREKEPLILLW